MEAKQENKKNTKRVLFSFKVWLGKYVAIQILQECSFQIPLLLTILARDDESHSQTTS